MSAEAGICGVFGVLLGHDELQDLVEEFREWIQDRKNKSGVTYADEADDVDTDDIVNTAKEWIERFREALLVLGVEVPDGARLNWTGSGDERPARCMAPVDESVLGFGIYTDPWRWEESYSASKWPKSFKEASDMWTWVWMG